MVFDGTKLGEICDQGETHRPGKYWERDNHRDSNNFGNFLFHYYSVCEQDELSLKTFERV